MRVNVVPRTYFEMHRGSPVEEACFERCSIISINAPSAGEEPPFSPEFLNAPNLLVLYFDDVADPVREKGIFMTPEDGDAIVGFIRRLDRSRQLYVHCTAGISRSGAVGEMLDWYFNCCLESHCEDHAMFLRRHPCLIPNRWVSRVLHEKLRHAANEMQNSR
ncbi:MAG: hypothetical protein HPZ91_00965 [Lentisphaeria bacterium]|nr:hypothetical protein [Lentisphaeria bacterium]